MVLCYYKLAHICITVLWDLSAKYQVPVKYEASKTPLKKSEAEKKTKNKQNILIFHKYIF